MGQNNLQMTGFWQGTYSYRAKWLQRLSGPTQFHMKLIEDEGCNLRGEVEDSVEDGGTPGTGTIEGRRKGLKVRWVKSMPIRATFKATKDEVELVVNEDKPHPTLIYTGELDPGGGLAHGVWKFGGWLGLINCRGTWEAELQRVPSPE